MERTLCFLLSLALAIGCASKLTHKSVTLAGGQRVDYVTGKVAGDGQEAVFRDAFIDGKPVVSHFGSGQSLAGQVLQGTVSSAMIAGGMVGAAAVLRPTRISETNNLSNAQEQEQGQQQGQGAYSGSYSHTSATASSVNSNSLTATNRNSNRNQNTNQTTIGDLGGGEGGGVPGCQKAKNGC
ncbi:MAG TPA: hypothetical protein VNL14_13965 [Candidatus Acidoferrales bacterium]|nr:hypothetical protein [Candidatus Acidoferrales bacterium]